jgi:hypothetical protein
MAAQDKRKNKKKQQKKEKKKGGKNATPSSPKSSSGSENVPSTAAIKEPYTIRGKSWASEVEEEIENNRRAGITIEDAGKCTSEASVTSRNASEQTAMEKLQALLRVPPVADKPRSVSDGLEQGRDEKVRDALLKGVRSGSVTEQDLKRLILTRLASFPFQPENAATSEIETDLAKLGVSLDHLRDKDTKSDVPSGLASSPTAPNCSVRSYKAPKIPSEIVEVVEVNEINEVNERDEVIKAEEWDFQDEIMVDKPAHKSDVPVDETENTTKVNGHSLHSQNPFQILETDFKNDASNEEETEVTECDQSEDSNPEDKNSIKVNYCSSQAQKKVDDSRSMTGVPFKEKVDGVDGYGSQTTETSQSDIFFDAQDVGPAGSENSNSWGKESKSDIMGELHYGEHQDTEPQGHADGAE